MSDRYVPTPVGFARSSKEPLDKYEVFNSIAEMKSYVATGSAYDGQVCKVKHGNALTLEYLFKNEDNILKIVQLYPDTIEKNFIFNNDFASYGFSNDLLNITNSSSNTTWWLAYHYDADTKRTYSTIDLYNMAPHNFSLLCNAELYNNNGINFALVVNGKVKCKWKQANNFITSSASSNSGACISKTANNKYLCPLNSNGADTGFGLFPKIAVNDYTSLYIGV